MDLVDARGVILHVEDDPSQREALAALLRMESFEVHEAPGGGEVQRLAPALRGRLDVLIVDYHLGDGTSGTEVAESLTRIMGYAVPTIVLTGDTANCEVPILPNAPVWVARKPLDARALLAGLPPLVQFRRQLTLAAHASER